MTITVKDIRHDANVDALTFIIEGQATDLQQAKQFIDGMAHFTTHLTTGFAATDLTVTVPNVSTYQNPQLAAFNFSGIESATFTMMGSLSLGLDTSKPLDPKAMLFSPKPKFAPVFPFIEAKGSLDTDLATQNLHLIITIETSGLTGHPDIQSGILHFAGHRGIGGILLSGSKQHYTSDATQIAQGRFTYRTTNGIAASDQITANTILKKDVASVAGMIGIASTNVITKP